MVRRESLFNWPELVTRLYILIFVLTSLSQISFSQTIDDQLVMATDSKALFKLGRKEDRKGRIDNAEKIYRRIIEVDPKYSDAKLALAYLLAKRRSVAEAYNLSFETAKAEPNNARAFAVLGVTLLTAGKFPEARRCFEKSLSIDRKEDLAWAALGMLEFYENRIDNSLIDLLEATFRDPEQPDYQFALGQVSARAERYKESAEAYKRFLEISTDMDSDRRLRIKGLINFLSYLGQKTSLYVTAGQEQAKLPFTLIGNRPVIKIRVNDGDELLNFVLDTGSGISVISDKTAKRLKIREITKGGYAKGIGGDGRFEIVYGFLHDVALDDVKIRNVPVYIRKFHTNSEDIDGYIGLSLISKFLTTIDYGDLSFSLTRREGPIASIVENDLSLPLRLTSSGFLSGEVKLEGVDDTFNFIVDTGASVSVISDEIAGLQEVSRYLRGAKMRVVGSAGVTEDVPSYMLPRVTFGNNSCESIAAIALDLDMINEASGFQQAGILGGNFLRNYRLTFDFKNSKVIFVPIK